MYYKVLFIGEWEIKCIKYIFLVGLMVKNMYFLFGGHMLQIQQTCYFNFFKIVSSIEKSIPSPMPSFIRYL
jgi:hypothetical protein